MSRFGAIAWLIPLLVWTSGAPAADFHIDEVPLLASNDRPQPHDIEFADHRSGGSPDAGTGLVPFESWARVRWESFMRPKTPGWDDPSRSSSYPKNS